MSTPSIPLFTGTYSIAGRKYRKTAYQLKSQSETDSKNGFPEKFTDTPDIYEDEPAQGCMAPPGLPVLKSKAIGAKKAKTEKELTPESSEPQETEDERIKVIQMGNGREKWIGNVLVPQCFMGKLIGMNRKALRTLESDTQCHVKTPRREENTPCEITSLASLECVQRCLDRIEIFLDDARKTSRPTHFIAFPCDQHEVQENFEIFKQMVVESEHFDVSCKNPLLFTKTARLHLTLAVARTFDDTDLQKTREVFTILQNEIKANLKSEPMIADIQGIDMMNDDPSEVSVIYAKVGGATIQGVANYVKKRLTEHGIAISEGEEDGVKLHMTLMNGRYVAQAENRKRYTFDATKVLEDLKNSYFGTFQLNEICLCPLNSSTSSDKFYEKLATIQIST
ncbi:unnamed protein product [Caenorhabditis sp. 36 PRJEB53466]|nr:unnamed protein product [Caenorhabditis sp. 36 PRJEB53466]